MIARIGGGVVAILLTGAVVGLSHMPYQVESGDEARLRLSWRFRAAVEECRELTEEELAELPVHMRREVVCQRRVPPFRLRVEVDGRAVLDEVVRAAGAQHDRPLYVFREISVEPGRRDVRIRFERVGEEGGRGEASEVEEREADTPGGSPSELVLETTLELEAREIALISYDPGAGLLRRVETPSPRAGDPASP